jgi:hypothetical protein
MLLTTLMWLIGVAQAAYPIHLHSGFYISKPSAVFEFDARGRPNGPGFDYFELYEQDGTCFDGTYRTVWKRHGELQKVAPLRVRLCETSDRSVILHEYHPNGTHHGVLAGSGFQIDYALPDGLIGSELYHPDVAADINAAALALK